MEFVGFKPTPDQIEKVQAFIDSQPEGALLGVRLFPNLDTTRSDVELPSGMQAIFSPSAKVDHTVIADNIFQVMAVTPCTEPRQVGGANLSVQGAVDQYPAMQVSGQIRRSKNNKETEVWAPELGGPGSFAGIYSKLHDDHRTKSYFIAARSTVAQYAKDYKESIGQAIAASGDNLTYRDLLFNSDLRQQLEYGKEAARRNVFRAMANVAEAVGVDIERTDDLASKLMDPNHAHPEMAAPDWIQSTYSIKSSVFNGKPAVLISYGVVPADECMTLKDGKFFVVANPYDGVAMFDISQHKDVAHGLPADTGRAPEGSGYAAPISSALSWDGEITPTLNNKPMTKEFKTGMRKLGWDAAEHEMQKLIPVATKIWSESATQ